VSKAASPAKTVSLTPELLDKLRPTTTHPLPKVRQLYLSFYQAIEQGELVFDTRLPSSRTLAQQLGLGRNTVIHVYEQLVSEGLLSSDGRRGTRVSRRIQKTATVHSGKLHQSQRSKRSRTSLSTFRKLAPGEPDTSLFPQSLWRKAEANAARKAGDKLGYQSQALPETREAIARYLSNYRSLAVEPEQIVITSGTRQSLILAASLFADTGDTAWLECPGYIGAADAFEQMGLKIMPCKVDQHGMVLPATSKPVPRIVYLTPCFQYPHGMPLAADRRQALLDLSRRHGTVLFEDDYDSEFRDDTQPRPSLAGDANGAHVLNAGTFSKLLFPAIRLGWVVVPKQIYNDAYIGLKAIGGGNNTIPQLVVTELLNNGSIARHLRHARQVYGQRRATLIDSLNGCTLLEPVDQVSGSLSLVLRLKQSVSIEVLENALRQQALGVQALERLDWSIRNPKRCKAIVVGLGNVSTLSIPATVKRLERAMKTAQSS